MSLIPTLLTGRSKLLLVLSAVAIVVPPSAAANLKLPYFLLCGLALIPGLIQSPSQASLSVLSA